VVWFVVVVLGGGVVLVLALCVVVEVLVWCVVVLVCGDVGLWRWCKGCVYGDVVRSEFGSGKKKDQVGVN
jgi:hypothetical protein